MPNAASHPGVWSRRPPSLEDGARLYRAVVDWGGLDVNSAYFYLLMAERFAETSALAERGGELGGFVLGLRLPDEPEGVFVWQVATSPAARGEGLARGLVHQVLEQTRASYLLAHVAEGNEPSERLFRSVATAHGAPCRVEPGFAARHFPVAHAPERLFRIGPLSL